MEPTKISVELLHCFDNRWTRFLNTDREFLTDFSSAIVYHHLSPDENIFRVCAKRMVFDVLTKPTVGQDTLKALHQRLRKSDIIHAQVYSLNKEMVDFINMRTKIAPQVRKWLEKLNRPHIVAFDKPTRGGLRQIEHLQQLNRKHPVLDRSAFGISFSIRTLTEEQYANSVLQSDPSADS